MSVNWYRSDEARPTALQLVVEAHDTPSRRSKLVPARFGLGTTVHVAPFHCSTRVVLTGDEFRLPTATQVVLDAHDTASSAESAGAAEAWIDHVVPFQRSMSGSVLVLELELPIAVHCVGLVHDTSKRLALFEPLGLGVGTVDHIVPFQRRAKVPEPFDPTATQLAVAGHATARRLFDVSDKPLVTAHTEPFHFSTNTRSESPAPTAVQFEAL
jgi:hypothetical protein